MVLESSLFLIKPCGMEFREDILDSITDVGDISSLTDYMNSPLDKIRSHYAAHKGCPYFDWILMMFEGRPMSTGIVTGDDAITALLDITGDRDPKKAYEENPDSIRGWAYHLMGETLERSISEGRACQNLIHRSRDTVSFLREFYIWYPDRRPPVVPRK